MSRILHISEKEIYLQAEKIFRVVREGESAVAMCYPGCKIDYNISCFLDSPLLLRQFLGQYYRKFFFIPVRLSDEDTALTFNHRIYLYLKEKKMYVPEHASLLEMCHYLLRKGYEPFFLIYNVQTVLANNLQTLISLVHKVICDVPRTRGILFIEANIHDELYVPIFRQNNKFLQNILTFPTYSLKESQLFVANLAKTWNVHLSRTLIHTIAVNCCGYLWILREAVRYIRDTKILNPSDIFTNPTMKLKLESIYQQLSYKERMAIVSLCFQNKNNVKSHITNYLLSLGVIAEKDKKYILILPLLEALFKDTRKKKLTLSSNSQVVLDGNNIENLFTRHELAVMKLLMNNGSKIITREEVAQAIWGEKWNDKYSDWAIDKLISRLRASLSRLGLPRNIITVKKGRGFMIYE